MNQVSVSTSIGMASIASSVLQNAKFRLVDDTRIGTWPVDIVSVYEDEYSIVAIAVFDTWEGLSDNWPVAQESFLDLISKTIGLTDAKALEGYLVLLTPSLTGEETELEITHIRYNTLRLRKLVATGSSIQIVGDIIRLLLLVLPLELQDNFEAAGSVRDLLPMVLSTKGVPEEVTKGLTKAFDDQEPLLEFLQEFADKS